MANLKGGTTIGGYIAWHQGNFTGGGDVTKVGTTVNDQLGIWTGDGTIEGNIFLTFSGTQFKIYQSTSSTIPMFKIEQNSTGDSSMEFRLNSGQSWAMGIDNTDTDSFVVSANNALGTNNRMKITTSGNVNFYSTVTTTSSMTATNFILSSDARLKTNISNAFPQKLKVDWKVFNLKSDLKQNRYGVIAQELELYHPEFVRTDNDGMKSVAYIDLLIAKNVELEDRLEKLEKLINKLLG